MSELKFDFSWRDAPGASDPAILHTMAELRIMVDGQAVTRVLDRKSRSDRESVFVALYPVAEWIVANWWPLLEENLAPRREDRLSFEARHCLYGAGDGFARPKLTIIPEGEIVLLQWKGCALERQPVEFLAAGTARLPREHLRVELSDFVEAVLARLSSFGVEDSWLAQEWQALNKLDEEQEVFCQASACLGLDPFDLSVENRQAILDAASVLPVELAEEVFRSVSPATLGQASRWVLQAVSRLDEAPPAFDLRTIRAAIHSSGPAAPWDQGYQMARQLRERISLSEEPPVSLESIFDGHPPIIQSKLPRVPNLDGIVRNFGGKSFRCFTGKLRPDSSQFLLARSLCAYIENKEDDLAMLSGAVTQRQKRNRAFAAELLAPARAIKSHIESEWITAEDIEDLGREFRVSSYVIEHQIKNHDLGVIVGPSGLP